MDALAVGIQSKKVNWLLDADIRGFFDTLNHERKTRAQGDVIIMRYADDFVVGFQHESDARRFLEELTERFHRFNLELHAEKTRVIEFGRFAAERRERRGQGKPQAFNFLGFYARLAHANDRPDSDRAAMPKYRVKINAENFLIEMGQKIARHGFVTHRFVEADDPRAAENQAVQMLRDGQDLRAVVRNPPDDPPS